MSGEDLTWEDEELSLINDPTLSDSDKQAIYEDSLEPAERAEPDE